MPVVRSDQLQVDSMSDAVSFATASIDQTRELLSKTKTTLAKLYSLVFPKLPQEKRLAELTEAFFLNHANPIEVLKRSSRVYGALLTFQILMGHGVDVDFEDMSAALPVAEDGTAIKLGQYTKRDRECARQLMEQVEANKKKKAEAADKTAASASKHTSAP